MSWDEKDAWLDELEFGDWPFKRWEIAYSLDLREGFTYTQHTRVRRGVDAIHYRLRNAFGLNRGNEELEVALNKVDQVVTDAVDHSRSEAMTTWLRHEVWLPVLDEGNNGEDDPAEILIDSLEVLGFDADEKLEACAALGLWLLGEHWYAEGNANRDHGAWALTQAAIVLAEAEYSRGELAAIKSQARRVSKRNLDAAVKRHESNRRNKELGRAIWDGKVWNVQADAERAISSQCNITISVAGRWIREFKHIVKASLCNAK